MTFAKCPFLDTKIHSYEKVKKDKNHFKIKFYICIHPHMILINCYSHRALYTCFTYCNAFPFGYSKVSKDTEMLLKKKYMRSLMTQYKYGQMIPSISWRGTQVEPLPNKWHTPNRTKLLTISMFVCWSIRHNFFRTHAHMESDYWVRTFGQNLVKT